MKQISDLKSCLLQRDNEISILVNMVKKGKTVDDVVTARDRSARSTYRQSIDVSSSSEMSIDKSGIKI